MAAGEGNQMHGVTGASLQRNLCSNPLERWYIGFVGAVCCGCALQYPGLKEDV